MISANIADDSMTSDAPESLLNDLLGKDDGALRSVIPEATAANRSISFTRPAGTMQLVGTNGDDLLQGVSGSSNIFTAGGNDAILAGSGDNYIFATNAQRRGAFERDYINVASGKDTIFLGDEQGSYYAANGWLDSAYVDGFDASEDRLVLFGSSDLYTVNSSEQGSWLMFGDDNSTAIAYLNGVIDFDLLGSAVAYLSKTAEGGGTAAEVPEIEAIAPEISSSVFSVQPEIREFDDVGGSPDDDLLVGGDSADRLLGFSGRDYAFGGGSADLFVLGDFNGTYYADKGWADSVYIDDFTVGVDQLQLSGTAREYSAVSDSAGTWILAQGDAIAYLNGVTSIDLGSLNYVSS